MLTSSPTKHGSGITLYGDSQDLQTIHETVHKFVDQPFVPPQLGEFVLGLAYDIRKAFEGQREKKTFGTDKLDKVSYFGVPVLWPQFLVQVGLLRRFAAFHVTNHRDHGMIYLLEDCAITSLLAQDLNVGKVCVDWLVTMSPFPNDYLAEFLNEQTLGFVKTPESKRFKSLPRLLTSILWFSPEYRQFEKRVTEAAKKLGCEAQSMRTSKEEDWPDFKW